MLSQAPSIEWWVEGTSSLLTSRDLYHVPSYPSFYVCATSLCLRSAKSTLQRSRPRNVLKNTAYFPDLPPVFRVNHDKPHPAPPLATLKSEAPLYLLSVTFDGLYGSTIAG